LALGFRVRNFMAGSVYGGLRVRIAEQNSTGCYYVTERDLDLGTVRSGRIALYRPSRAGQVRDKKKAPPVSGRRSWCDSVNQGPD